MSPTPRIMDLKELREKKNLPLSFTPFPFWVGGVAPMPGASFFFLYYKLISIYFRCKSEEQTDKLLETKFDKWELFKLKVDRFLNISFDKICCFLIFIPDHSH